MTRIPRELYVGYHSFLNTIRPRKSGRQSRDEIFKCTFLNENCSILMEISLKVIPKHPVNIKSASRIVYKLLQFPIDAILTRSNQHWCWDNNLVPNRRQGIIKTNNVYWCIHGSFGIIKIFSTKIKKGTSRRRQLISFRFEINSLCQCTIKFNNKNVPSATFAKIFAASLIIIKPGLPQPHGCVIPGICLY